MPPALKVLSLVTTILCVILFLWMFSLDDILLQKNRDKHSKSSSLNDSFMFTKKSKKEVASTTEDLTTGTSTVVATTTENLIPVFENIEHETYIDYDATTTRYINIDRLEKIGGNYYKGKEGVYYLASPTSACTDKVTNLLIKLPIQDSSLINQVYFGNFIRDVANVFILFVKVKNADASTFSYVGIAESTEDYGAGINRYWYKDKNKIFTFVASADSCKGYNFFEEENSLLNEADPITFEYIGAATSDARSAYAKDKNYFYTTNGKISDTVTPITCKGNFFEECLPKIEQEKIQTEKTQGENNQPENQNQDQVASTTLFN